MQTNFKQSKSCEQCGKALVKRKPCRMRRARFCSTRCAYAHRIAANQRKRGKCRVCGGEMPSGDWRKTCSAKCGYEQRKLRMRKQRPCNHCGKLYWPLRLTSIKYCSRKCYYAEVGKRPAMVTVACAHCGASIRRTAAAVKRQSKSFCSRECQGLGTRGEAHALYRGPKDPNRGPEWRRLANAIRLRDSFSCRRCGRCEGGILTKLSVDHVRPWRSFTDKTAANHPDNLVSLCRPCHSYKTTVVERAWLRGDVLAFNQWVRSLHIESAAAAGISVEKNAKGNWEVRKQGQLV